ncbi:MAG: RNA polymerase sigma factor, partial [Calditrichaeota bacterium]|nr:RNA polymerase sigma factor [Calditrichota bacterium]
RFRSGDDLAYVLLYNRYKRRVLAFCRGYVGGNGAEDVVQEVFLRLYRNRHKLDGDGFRAILFTVARNLCMNALRDRKRTEPLGEGHIPSTSALGRHLEAKDLLSRLLSQLNDTERELFLLREVAGLPYEELALVLGKNPGALRVQMLRVRQKLRAMLARLEEEENRR